MWHVSGSTASLCPLPPHAKELDHLAGFSYICKIKLSYSYFFKMQRYSYLVEDLSLTWEERKTDRIKRTTNIVHTSVRTRLVYSSY